MGRCCGARDGREGGGARLARVGGGALGGGRCGLCLLPGWAEVNCVCMCVCVCHSFM